MKTTIREGWRHYAPIWEGVCYWMYLDTKGKVTTATGNLIDSVSDARKLKWYVKSTGKLATVAEIDTEWYAVKKLQTWKKLNGLNSKWIGRAKLILKQDEVDRLFDTKTDEFWNGLKRSLPDLEWFPADAGLAVMDESWQNGWAYLEMKNSDGSYVWAGTRSALLKKNFSAAADHVPAGGARSEFRQRLFRNAEIVQNNSMDPNILWDTKKPIVTEDKGFDMASSKGVYFHNAADQKLKVSTTDNPADNLVFFTEKNPTYVTVVTGESDGVDIKAVLNIVDETGTRIREYGEAFWRIDSVKAGTPDVHWHDRESTTSDTVHFSGTIHGNPPAGRNLRLRLVVRTNRIGLSIKAVETTGFIVS